MKNISKGFIFFIGWILSPLTWWNDAFINLPLSYLTANALFYVIPIPFMWLVVVNYWITNLIGLVFMYLSGRSLILSSRDRKKTIMTMLIFMIIYTLVMAYLDKVGKLVPLCVFFEKYYITR